MIEITILLDVKFYGMLITNKARLRDCNSFLGYCLATLDLLFPKARLRDKKLSRLFFAFAALSFLFLCSIQTHQDKSNFPL